MSIRRLEYEMMLKTPPLAREVFSYLKHCADFKTGIAGLSYHISYSHMADKLSFKGAPGIKAVYYSENQLRRAVTQLIKHGLISPNLDQREYNQNKRHSKTLVFTIATIANKETITYAQNQLQKDGDLIFKNLTFNENFRALSKNSRHQVDGNGNTYMPTYTSHAEHNEIDLNAKADVLSNYLLKEINNTTTADLVINDNNFDLEKDGLCDKPKSQYLNANELSQARTENTQLIKFNIFKGWKPNSINFASYLADNGLTAQDVTVTKTHEFIEYNLGKEILEQKTQEGWERYFARYLVNSKKFAAEQAKQDEVNKKIESIKAQNLQEKLAYEQSKITFADISKDYNFVENHITAEVILSCGFSKANITRDELANNFSEFSCFYSHRNDVKHTQFEWHKLFVEDTLRKRTLKFLELKNLAKKVKKYQLNFISDKQNQAKQINNEPLCLINDWCKQFNCDEFKRIELKPRGLENYFSTDFIVNNLTEFEKTRSKKWANAQKTLTAWNECFFNHLQYQKEFYGKQDDHHLRSQTTKSISSILGLNKLPNTEAGKKAHADLMQKINANSVEEVKHKLNEPNAQKAYEYAYAEFTNNANSDISCLKVARLIGNKFNLEQNLAELISKNAYKKTDKAQNSKAEFEQSKIYKLTLNYGRIICDKWLKDWAKDTKLTAELLEKLKNKTCELTHRLVNRLTDIEIKQIKAFDKNHDIADICKDLAELAIKQVIEFEQKNISQVTNTNLVQISRKQKEQTHLANLNKVFDGQNIVNSANYQQALSFANSFINGNLDKLPNLNAVLIKKFGASYFGSETVTNCLFAMIKNNLKKELICVQANSLGNPNNLNVINEAQYA